MNVYDETQSFPAPDPNTPDVPPSPESRPTSTKPKGRCEEGECRTLAVGSYEGRALCIRHLRWAREAAEQAEQQAESGEEPTDG